MSCSEWRCLLRPSPHRRPQSPPPRGRGQTLFGGDDILYHDGGLMFQISFHVVALDFFLCFFLGVAFIMVVNPIPASPSRFIFLSLYALLKVSPLSPSRRCIQGRERKAETETLSFLPSFLSTLAHSLLRQFHAGPPAGLATLLPPLLPRHEELLPVTMLSKPPCTFAHMKSLIVHTICMRVSLTFLVWISQMLTCSLVMFSLRGGHASKSLRRGTMDNFLFAFPRSPSVPQKNTEKAGCSVQL